jgi:hypothetical protein
MSPRRNWDSPKPSLASGCGPPPDQRVGGAHSPAAKGVGEFQFRRLEKKFRTLPTLWGGHMGLFSKLNIFHDFKNPIY